MRQQLEVLAHRTRRLATSVKRSLPRQSKMTTTDHQLKDLADALLSLTSVVESLGHQLDHIDGGQP